MARLYLGYNERGLVVSKNVRIGSTGQPLVLLDQYEAEPVVLDFTAYLQPGETILSAVGTALACTATVTVASPLINLTLGNVTSWVDGDVTLIITFSSAAVLSQVIKVRRKNRVDDEQRLTDYV